MSKSNIGFYLGKKRKFFVFFLRVLQIFIISLEGVLLVFISNDTWACSENIWKRVMTPPPPKVFYRFWFNIFFLSLSVSAVEEKMVMCVCITLIKTILILNLSFKFELPVVYYEWNKLIPIWHVLVFRKMVRLGMGWGGQALENISWKLNRYSDFLVKKAPFLIKFYINRKKKS